MTPDKKTSHKKKTHSKSKKVAKRVVTGAAAVGAVLLARKALKARKMRAQTSTSYAPPKKESVYRSAAKKLILTKHEKEILEKAKNKKPKFSLKDLLKKMQRK